jgi:hypothetical protein
MNYEAALSLRLIVPILRIANIANYADERIHERFVLGLCRAFSQSRGESRVLDHLMTRWSRSLALAAVAAIRLTSALGK